MSEEGTIGVCSRCGEWTSTDDECCPGAKIYSEGGAVDPDEKDE